MKKTRSFISIEVSREEKIDIEVAAIKVNKEDITTYCRRKIFATENEVQKENSYLKEMIENLQSEKEAAELKTTELEAVHTSEIEKLNTDLEVAKNSEKLYGQECSSKVEENKKQAKKIKALEDELSELKRQKFVTEHDLYLHFTQDERKVVDLAIPYVAEHKRNIEFKTIDDFVKTGIKEFIGSVQKYYPAEYINEGTKENKIWESLRKKLVFES